MTDLGGSGACRRYCKHMIDKSCIYIYIYIHIICTLVRNSPSNGKLVGMQIPYMVHTLVHIGYIIDPKWILNIINLMVDDATLLVSIEPKP